MRPLREGTVSTSVALCSLSLLRQKSRIEVAYPEYTFISPFKIARSSAYLGSRGVSSGRWAGLLAKLSGSESLILSRGFLNRYSPDLAEPACSYLIGNSTDPHSAIRASISEVSLSDADITRATSAMQALRASRLSIFNNAPELLSSIADFDQDKPYVLLIDQSAEDMQIAQKIDRDSSILQMMQRAKQSWPSHQIVIRPCESLTMRGVLEREARADPSAWVAPRRTNVWDLIENADHVYTHSGHAGFEALVAGKPVTCCGTPFYAGHGLTEGLGPIAISPRDTSQRVTLAHIFTAAYLTCSRYVDPHTNKPSTFEDTLDRLSCIAKARNSNQTGFVTVNFSLWKRRATEAFLIGVNGKPKHKRDLSEACKVAHKSGASLAIWGSDADNSKISTNDVSTVRLEDAFIRSVGLGAHFHFPSSLVLEPTRFLYYDARGESALEKLIRTQKLGTRALQRAKTLRNTIVAQGINKYNLSHAAADSPPQTDQFKILVPGQVEDDASIKFGAGEIRTNAQLLKAVRERYPQACIGYRAHPDVASKARAGAIEDELVAQIANFDAGAMDINDLLNWCDRVETITSLTGFEALLRGVSVGTYGWPFYAGWGLTDDRWDKPARGHATLDELVYAALVDYPLYVHPISRLPCEVERILDSFSNSPSVPTLKKRFLHPAGLVLGRIKHRWRSR